VKIHPLNLISTFLRRAARFSATYFTCLDAPPIVRSPFCATRSRACATPALKTGLPVGRGRGRVGGALRAY